MASDDDDDQPVCSCQVKPYDEADPTTWKRPKYVTLHDADSKCCRPPVHTVFDKDDEKSKEMSGTALNPFPSVTQGSKRVGSDKFFSRVTRPPVPIFKQQEESKEDQSGVNKGRELVPTTIYESNNDSSTNSVWKDQPTLVNGRLVPSRLSAMETHTSKNGVQSVGKETTSDVDEGGILDFMSESSTRKITYGRRRSQNVCISCHIYRFN